MAERRQRHRPPSLAIDFSGAARGGPLAIVILVDRLPDAQPSAAQTAAAQTAAATAKPPAWDSGIPRSAWSTPTTALLSSAGPAPASTSPAPGRSTLHIASLHPVSHAAASPHASRNAPRPASEQVLVLVLTRHDQPAPRIAIQPATAGAPGRIAIDTTTATWDAKDVRFAPR